MEKKYLNVPVDRSGQERVFSISVGGVPRREFPVQLAEHAPDYWVFLDVSEFQGSTITLTNSDGGAPVSQTALNRIYQADQIQGAATLYKEAERPAFHFTVKRGWNNDVNGPIYMDGQYHLFWQAYPFGLQPDVGFMYWGHAVGTDLVHWKELSPALMPDKLGGVWSGTSLIDHNNAGGWGKDALVVFYTAYDRRSHKQVQCIAYSTDKGATFQRYNGNPVIDSNQVVGSNDTRDPKVFWYQPGQHWVLVLFEKDGMSFYNSTDLKTWTKKSHLPGFHECPDLFELAVDGDPSHKKWVLHGGSSAYVIGSFDGETFTPETPVLHYAEGKNAHGDDVLYAAESFVNMPDGRTVQMAWGRIPYAGMPFNQLLLFPTEFKLHATQDGLRLQAEPIAELAQLRTSPHAWPTLAIADANQQLNRAGAKPIDVTFSASLASNDALTLRYGGQEIATIAPGDLPQPGGQIEVLIDKGIAEVFVNGGARYVTREIPLHPGVHGLQLETKQNQGVLHGVKIYQIKSMWRPQA